VGLAAAAPRAQRRSTSKADEGSTVVGSTNFNAYSAFKSFTLGPPLVACTQVQEGAAGAVPRV
jgi:hypothetical protein